MSSRPPVPEGWEFRLSHDRRLFAFYDPGNGPWFVPEPAMRGRFVDSAEMNRLDWYRYVPADVRATPDSELEVQRLALSEAVDLGTGAPWDAIRDRVAELKEDAARLSRLEAAGVDNWEGYSNAFE